MSYNLSSRCPLLRVSVPLCEIFCRFFVAAITSLVTLSAQAAEPPLRVVAGVDGKPTAVEAVGLNKNQLGKLAPLPADDPQWPPLLSVYVKRATGGDEVPALAGNYQVVGEAIRFTPRYPLVPGLKYHAEFVLPAESPGGHSQYFGLDINVPAKEPTEPPRVTAIFPTAAVLPENQLRFYVHFSKPMRDGEAYEHIKLLKPDGQSDTRAFFDVGDELWDHTGTRLTLFFHPGRVKQGLQPREEFGPVLESGKQYTLVVEKGWRDADGQPLAANFEKRFTAGPMIEKGLDPAQWKITSPQAGTREALIVRFPHSLDRALLARKITVASEGEKRIAGNITITEDERRWEFQPEAAWPAGDFALVVETTLEDTAGNKVGQPFEVDVFERVDDRAGPEFVRIPFAIQQK